MYSGVLLSTRPHEHCNAEQEPGTPGAASTKFYVPFMCRGVAERIR